jgi:hypothetical protein
MGSSIRMQSIELSKLFQYLINIKQLRHHKIVLGNPGWILALLSDVIVMGLGETIIKYW